MYDHAKSWKFRDQLQVFIPYLSLTITRLSRTFCANYKLLVTDGLDESLTGEGKVIDLRTDDRLLDLDDDLFVSSIKNLKTLYEKKNTTTFNYE